MLTIRPSAERGHARHGGWLDSRHTFSFGSYYDPAHMGFRQLRVINDDNVAPAAGFPAHPHRDMEIVSYVVSGGLEHRDSMGNGSVIRPGDVQRMSAGTGVTHSEYNHSRSEPVRFLQIWIQPGQRGLPPSYEQKNFAERRRGQLALVASPDGRDDSVTLHQDASIYAAELEAGQRVSHRLAEERHAWVQVIDGALELTAGDGGAPVALEGGDGASLSAAGELGFEAIGHAHFLLFDLS